MSAEPTLGLPRSRGSRPMFSTGEEKKIVEFVTRYFERGKKFSGFQLLDFLVGYLEKYPRAKKKSKTKKPSNIWFNSWQVRHPEVARFFGKGLGKRESVDLTEEGRSQIVEELIQCVEEALTPAQLYRNNLELAEKVAKQVKREAAKRSPRRKVKAKKFLSPKIRKPRTSKTPRRRIKKEVHTAQLDAIEGPLTSTPSCNALVPISPVDSNSSSIGSFQISPHIHSSSGHEDHDGPSPGNAPLNLPAPRTTPLLTPKVEPGTSSEPPTAVPCTSNIPAPRTTSKPGRGRPRNKESKIRKIKNKPTSTASTATAGTSEEATCSSTQPKKKRKRELNDVSDVQPQVPDPDTQQAKKPRQPSIKLFIRANNQKLSVHTPHEVAGGSDTPNPAQYVVAVRTPAAVKSTGRSRAGKQEMPDNAVPLCPIIWEVGFSMEAYDFRSWWCAKLAEVTAYRVKVHFIGWGSKYDKVYEKTSVEIRGPTTHVSAPPVPEINSGAASTSATSGDQARVSIFNDQSSSFRGFVSLFEEANATQKQLASAEARLRSPNVMDNVIQAYKEYKRSLLAALLIDTDFNEMAIDLNSDN